MRTKWFAHLNCWSEFVEHILVVGMSCYTKLKVDGSFVIILGLESGFFASIFDCCVTNMGFELSSALSLLRIEARS